MKITVKDPDYYYKTQHIIRGSDNRNDLHHGHEIKIDNTGYWNSARHYGVFVYVYNEVTGSKTAIVARKFKKRGITK
jgi:hypothetical protein